jgi:hypothetical protein
MGCWPLQAGISICWFVSCDFGTSWELSLMSHRSHPCFRAGRDQSTHKEETCNQGLEKVFDWGYNQGCKMHEYKYP